MNIGPYSLPSQVLLAPMAGTSDKPFRMICRAQGAGLTTSEMVVMQNHLLNSNKSKHRLDFTSEQSPISIQIAGSEAEELAESARKAVDFGADIIDINMGCPAKKVCNKAAGSALMQNEKLVEDIIKSVVNAVDIPVTLKMRTGWNEENKNAPIIAKIAEDFGIQMLAIHGRTRSQKYNGEAEFNTVKKITKMVSIPVVANGDITSPEKAKDVLDFTGAEAVMLGRATQGNPWLVGQVNHFLKTGNTYSPAQCPSSSTSFQGAPDESNNSTIDSFPCVSHARMRVVLELEILFKTQSVPCSEMILWTSARSLASMALKISSSYSSSSFGG